MKSEDELPQHTGPYRVKNQYGQTAQSFWNGKEWDGWMFPKGNCMLYNDAKIVEWDYLEVPGVYRYG